MLISVLTMRGFLWDPPRVPIYYNFAWVPHTFGGVWPLLTLPYFAHWFAYAWTISVLLLTHLCHLTQMCYHYYNYMPKIFKLWNILVRHKYMCRKYHRWIRVQRLSSIICITWRNFVSRNSLSKFPVDYYCESAYVNVDTGCRTKRPKLNDTTLHLNIIEQRYFKQQKTGKTGSRLQKNKVLINTSK